MRYSYGKSEGVVPIPFTLIVKIITTLEVYPLNRLTENNWTLLHLFLLMVPNYNVVYERWMKVFNELTNEINSKLFQNNS